MSFEALLLYSLLGLLLGLIFGVLNFGSINHRADGIHKLFTDTLFFSFATVLSYILSIAVSYGRVRLFEIVAEIISGYCSYLVAISILSPIMSMISLIKHKTKAILCIVISCLRANIRQKSSFGDKKTTRYANKDKKTSQNT